MGPRSRACATAPRLIVVASIHLNCPLSHFRSVVVLACSINASGCLFQTGIFLNDRTLSLETLLYLFRFFEDLLSTWTALLQILSAESFDLRRTGSRIYFDFITQPLQLLREVRPVDC